MKILAIDPGYDRLGVAIVTKEKGQKEILVYSNCLVTNRNDSLHERIFSLGSALHKIIEEYKPDIMAIEKLYFSKNQKTALMVAEARGVILYEGMRGGLHIMELSPSDIKIAVTGYGSATKEAIFKMVPKLIAFPEKEMLDDEVDAIAIGITAHAHSHLFPHLQ